MTNMINPTSSTSGLSTGTSTPSKNTSSTSDIIASFKEILSVMTATGGMSTSDPSAGMGMNMGMNMSDLMAPLMLLMIERLLEQDLNQNSSTAETSQATSAASSAISTAQSSAATGQTSSVGTVGSRSVPSGRPVEGRITQEPHSGHMAFDIAVPVGTPVKTTMDGKVVHAGWNDQGYGNLVIVENGPYRTYYAHLSSIPVSVGDQVAAGSVIGLSGNTGHSTGPHLHYEIRQNKVAIDPTGMMLGSS